MIRRVAQAFRPTVAWPSARNLRAWRKTFTHRYGESIKTPDDRLPRGQRALRVVWIARIFVVDDEVYLQDLYTDILTMVGHEVVERAYNGEEAVIKYEAMGNRPDLIIMDHRMPIKNGIEATREILAFDPAARVLFISADVSQEGFVRRIGAFGFLEKPFPMDRLFHVIAKVLEQAPAPPPAAG